MPKTKDTTRSIRVQLPPRLELGTIVRNLRNVRQDPNASPALIESAEALANELEEDRHASV